MDRPRGYVTSVISLFVAWVGFNINLGCFDSKADTITMGITILCVIAGFVQTIRVNPWGSKHVAPIAIAGCVGIAASYVGIFIV